MKISVIILNWNNGAETLQCVRSVASWTQLNPDIWMVDNASRDRSGQEVAKQCPTPHYIFSETNRGFAGGNNLAIEEILKRECDAILLLNNDAFILEKNVICLVKALADNPQLGIIGPVIQENDGVRTRLSLGGRDISRHINTRAYARENAVKPAAKDNLLFVDYVPGTVALIKTDVCRAIGLLDEDYFFSGEMSDFCERARNNGYSCAIDTRALAVHQTGRSASVRDTLYLYYTLRNRFLFIRKFRGSQKVYLYSFWCCCGLLMLVRALARFQGKKAMATGLALLDGLRRRYGNQNERVLS